MCIYIYKLNISCIFTCFKYIRTSSMRSQSTKCLSTRQQQGVSMQTKDTLGDLFHLAKDWANSM